MPDLISEFRGVCLAAKAATCVGLTLALAALPSWPATAGDGSAGAQAGVAQFSGILDRYAVRPDWKVAGVDYYVGTPGGTALKDPASISMAGVSVDRSGHTVTVSRSGITLSGYDFGLNGGWKVDVVNDANDVTITNSQFKVGANNLMPVEAHYGGTINVLNCTFDGGASEGSSVKAMVFAGAGGATIEYNRFANFPDDGIDITHDGDYVIRYNVFDAMGAGNFHTDAIQTYFSAISSLSIQYNTMYEPPSMSNGGINSFVRIGDQRGNVVHHPVAAYNTIIMASTSANAANVFQWDSGGTGTLVNPEIHDNFIDPRGVLYAVISPTLHHLDGVVNPTSYGNYNLRTAKLILSGPYNSLSSVPMRPPMPPAIIGAEVGSGATVSGRSVPHLRVDIYDGRNLMGSLRASASGEWSLPAPWALKESVISARVTDAYANSSSPSPSFIPIK
ncbi:right-handed parallel beta-helix repeat-containing protein [Bradyrhizobium genosp. L]|uniref:right-handed parallel beta-helix repeat-containing protein n=1 Tax=Bradyrhizobium genosp. L TaxID=83637 RepID=UPI0018A26051|nr:right-handed parallel beta-helix repeat-containing protein [Bradyrhizobium genosp. L]QPF86524.1 right-handed parallel beta-helix repeat-containing protein [Bradyrhizobium genosp. L]